MNRKKIKVYLCYFLLLSFTILTGPSCSRKESRAANTTPQRPSSRYEDLTKRLNSLNLRSNLLAHRVNEMKGDISFSQGNYFEAQKYYRRVINDFRVRDSLSVMMRLELMLMLSFDRMGDYSLMAHSIEDYEASAQKVGSPVYLATVPFFKGKVAYYRGESEKGYALMRQGIDMMRRAKGDGKDDYLMYFYNSALKMLQKDKMPKRAIVLLKAMEEMFSYPHRDSGSVAFPYETYLKEYYGCRAITLQRIGHEEEAAAYYNKFLAMAQVYIFDLKCIEAYLFEKKLYDDIIRFGKLRLDFLIASGDTLNSNTMPLYRLMAKAYAEKGLYDEAIECYNLMDKSNEELTRMGELSAIDEISANYSTHIAALDKQRKEHRSRLVYILIIVGIVIIMTALTVIRSIQYNRIIKRKNLSLVKTVDELMKRPPSISPEGEGSPPCSPSPSGEMEGGLRRKSMESLTDYQERKTFARMNHDIVEKKLYLDPNLSRATLLEKYNIPRNNFSPMFQKFTGTSYTTYINNLRLEEAARMLKEQPNYTIESIATDSGIPSVATLYRLFAQRYGMTPAEYRQTVLLSESMRNEDVEEGEE